MISLNQITVPVLKNLLADQPTTAAKVGFAWQAVAGPTIARHTKAAWAENGTLRIRSTGAMWDREVGRLREILLGRLHAILGPDVVRKIVIAKE